MTDLVDTQSNVTETQEILLAAVDENMFPQLIQGQITQLNELNEGVKNALAAAAKAEQHAKSASQKSAGWSMLGGKKKDAIEGLQEAGVELAGALQSSAKAQKLSFDLQTRLAEISKYLFTLGVNNIANNRKVVRELELRLSDASEEELSELARKEMLSVVLQLKEQEDLLRKQDQMKERLKEHNLKIRYLLEQTDNLELCQKQTVEAQQQNILALQQEVAGHQAGLETLTAGLAQTNSHTKQARGDLLARSADLDTRLKEQYGQQLILMARIDSVADAMGQTAEAQQQNISVLQQEVAGYQAGLETLTTGLTQASSHAEQARRDFLTRSEDLDTRLSEQYGQQRALADMIGSVIQNSKQQQQALLTLQHQVVSQQADLERLVAALNQSRSVLNIRTALLVCLVTTLTAVAYFLR